MTCFARASAHMSLFLSSAKLRGVSGKKSGQCAPGQVVRSVSWSMSVLVDTFYTSMCTAHMSFLEQKTLPLCRQTTQQVRAPGSRGVGIAALATPLPPQASASARHRLAIAVPTGSACWRLLAILNSRLFTCGDPEVLHIVRWRQCVGH